MKRKLIVALTVVALGVSVIGAGSKLTRDKGMWGTKDGVTVCDKGMWG